MIYLLCALFFGLWVMTGESIYGLLLIIFLVLAAGDYMERK